MYDELPREQEEYDEQTKRIIREYPEW